MNQAEPCSKCGQNKENAADQTIRVLKSIGIGIAIFGTAAIFIGLLGHYYL